MRIYKKNNLRSDQNKYYQLIVERMGSENVFQWNSQIWNSIYIQMLDQTWTPIYIQTRDQTDENFKR